MGAFSCCLVVVTAADRAAATYQRWVRYQLIKRGAKVSKGRSQSPLVVFEENETVTFGGFAATPRLLPQKGGPFAERMVEDIRSHHGSKLAKKKAYPQSALRLTASSAEGAFRRHTPQSLP